MLSVTRLLCGRPTPGDSLRYGETAGREEGLPRFQAHNKPVLVWNVARLTDLQRPASRQRPMRLQPRSRVRRELLSLPPSNGKLTSKYINDQGGTHE